jgi:hypothetical protein
MHTVDRDGSGKTAGYAYAISTDGARTFSVPEPVTKVRWRIGPIIATYNGVGMRNRTVLLPGGTEAFAAYGDGRSGYSGLYGTLLTIDIPR